MSPGQAINAASNVAWSWEEWLASAAILISIGALIVSVFNYRIAKQSNNIQIHDRKLELLKLAYEIQNSFLESYLLPDTNFNLILEIDRRWKLYFKNPEIGREVEKLFEMHRAIQESYVDDDMGGQQPENEGLYGAGMADLFKGLNRLIQLFMREMSLVK